MLKCDPRAFAQCPDRKFCGSTAMDCSFVEGSECDKFNQQVLSRPVTNGDKIRAMSDNELAQFLADRCVKASGQQLNTATGQRAIMRTWYFAWIGWLRQPAEVQK